MKHFVRIVFLLILLTACSGPAVPRPPVRPTATVATTAGPTLLPPALVPATDIYENNVHLFDYDTDTPPSITEHSVQPEDGYDVHDISYTSPKTGDVPAYLIVPDGPGPFAGILLMHGSSGSRTTLLPLAKDLVHTGAVILTVSAPSRG